VTSLGNQCGEGWLLAGEMVELIDSGVPNIVPIDYDPGASDVNQLNRIKLMMATAHKNLKKTGS
jgi:predicted nucleotide-binding protein (sugar kinase/HSP70/actin superfamily)